LFFDDAGLFLFGIHRDDRLPRLLEALHVLIDVLELRIAVGVIGALLRLPIRLQAVSEGVEQGVDRALAHAMPLLLQGMG